MTGLRHFAYGVLDHLGGGWGAGMAKRKSSSSLTAGDGPGGKPVRASPMLNRSEAARFLRLALGFALVGTLFLLAAAFNNLPKLASYGPPPSVRHLHVYCFVSGGLHLGNHSCPNMQALYLRSFVGSVAGESLEWTYHAVDSEEFLRPGNNGPLKDVPAGSLIVAHSARSRRPYCLVARALRDACRAPNPCPSSLAP